jgi:hypothetical protein
VENKIFENGAPFREVHAVEAIGDLPHEADLDSKYEGPPTNPFQAKAIISNY